eukprot:TRINITY_DN914_c6_g1_i2.p1 TRINITY_DN914_c6_g1~~TRINITY_DN914_c6_g1_i2.p1  ORF type:complete len:433 (-),score=166.55 TRINITY_DN914_c6_g1_i2:892-2130(-)
MTKKKHQRKKQQQSQQLPNEAAAGGTATTRLSPGLAEGRLVLLHGLSAARYNGRRAFIKHNDDVTGRWAVELMDSGETILIKADNLTATDQIVDLHIADTRLANRDVCHEYSQCLLDAVLSSASGGRRSSTPPAASVLPTDPEAIVQLARDAGDHSLLVVRANAIAHHFSLEVVCAPPPPPPPPSSAAAPAAAEQGPEGQQGQQRRRRVYARLLQADIRLIVTSGMRDVQKGFTPKDWLSSSGSAWMNEKQLLNFLTKLQRLRVLVTALSEGDLKDCAESLGYTSLAAQRAWAAAVTAPARLKRDGLTLQPGQLDNCASYREEMLRSGYPAHMVVYGGVTSGAPQQLLDFPLDAGEAILRAYLDLFSSDVTAALFVRAVEFRRSDAAWSCVAVAVPPPPPLAAAGDAAVPGV